MRSTLRKLGAVEVRQNGCHLTIKHGDCQAVIPVHGGDIPKGTLRNIERAMEPALGKGWLTQ